MSKYDQILLSDRLRLASDADEPLLYDDPRRFVLFPIQYSDVSD